MTPNEVLLVTKDARVIVTMFNDDVQVKDCEVREVQVTLELIEKVCGKVIANFDSAGSYGICLNVKVYEVVGFELRFEFLDIVIDVIVDGMVIRTEIPVINC